MRISTSAFLLALAPAAAAQDLFAVSWGGTAYRIDSTTGVGAAIAPTQSMGHNCLAVDPSGVPWSTQGFGAPPPTYDLVTFDPTTGAPTLRFSNIGDLRGLAFDATGVLYAIVQASIDELWTIDTTTGTKTRIGATGFGGLQALEDVQGTLYSYDVIRGLVRIDRTTGAGTIVNPSAGLVTVQFLTARADGLLLGGRDSLYLIDPATGSATLLGSGGYSDVRGADSVCATPYGSGCAGSLGFVPYLGAKACLSAGGTGTLVVGRGLGGAPSALFLGLGRGSLPLGAGCTLWLSGVVPLAIPIGLGGAGAGNGAGSISFPIPLGTTGALVTFQDAVVDSGSPIGIAVTAGLQVVVQ